MDTINITEVKARFSELLEKAAKGEPFIIAKAGKPLVKVVPFDEPEPKSIKRIGFLQGQGTVPDDFDTFAQDEIEEMLGLKD